METKKTSEAVSGWLGSLGFEPDKAGAGDGALLLRAPGRRGRLCAVACSLRDARVDDLRGRLATAVLRSKKACTRKDDVPAAIAWLPRWSRRAETEAAEFMTKYAPDCAWGIGSADGGGVFSLPGRGEIGRRLPAGTARPIARRRDAVDLFSDANRLMLKILLLRDAPTELWGGPRGPAGNVLELGRLAGVSPEAAYRLVRTLETEGFMDAGRRPLVIVRREALISRWLDRERQTRPVFWHARWLYGRPKDPRDVFGGPAALSYAMAGFSACELLGVLHAAPPKLIDVHVSGALPAALETWKLERVEQRDADIVLRPTRHRRSVFGGPVEKRGLRVADALQAALDVVISDARGTEQAEFIVRHVLGPGGDA